LILLNEDGSEGEWIDMSTHSYDSLTKLFEEKGFKRKMLL